MFMRWYWYCTVCYIHNYNKSISFFFAVQYGTHQIRVQGREKVGLTKGGLGQGHF